MNPLFLFALDCALLLILWYGCVTCPACGEGLEDDALGVAFCRQCGWRA